MALTANEEKAFRAVLLDASDRGLLTPIAFDPATDTRFYIKSLIQAARNVIVTERAELPARNTLLTNQIAVLDGLLAKFPA
jgi:hypothetical protein